MFEADSLPFLLYISTLIFAEKIMIASTCLISAVKLWLILILVTCLKSNFRRSKTNNFSGNRNISNFLLHIILSIQKSLSINFFKYNGKGWSQRVREMIWISIYQKLYLPLFTALDSKLINNGSFLLWNYNFHIVYVGGREICDKNKRNIIYVISDRNKLVTDIFCKCERAKK
ncbi:hypothetical protein GLOIN_2v1528341 [Rhizophagus irregularis DAOM 181602=DAOM 197198]|nr:hypothetical protein GLOIN_2v1528341 [Rhizophagus irregularis DAOM 181602=DAOM 197198]